MEIIVEIGTDEQKLQITKELRVIESLVEKYDPPIQLTQVIVASDFQGKINSLEGIDSYKSARGLGSVGITATARLAKVYDGFAIVLSPFLYNRPLA